MCFRLLYNIVLVAFVTVLLPCIAFACSLCCWLLRNCQYLKNGTTNQLDVFGETEKDPNCVVEWLKHRTDDQHGLGSKPTCAILLCPWERHFMPLSPAWWSWQAVLNYNNISTKLLADSNILASPEAGRGNCLPYV